MATKTSKLHTTFTGDDKQFQRTAGRVVKSGTQMGTMAGKLKGAFAAMGGAFVIKGIVAQFDRIGKVAKRVGMTAEEVQRLAHASELAGTSFETLQAILTRLQRRIGEALQNPASAAAQAFDELGLSATELSGMELKEQFFAVADAFKATEGSVSGVASLMKLLDTEARNLIPLFQEGATGIQTMMDGATVATNKTVKALEDVSDKLTEVKNKAAATFANVLVGAFTVWERTSAKASGDILEMIEGLKQWRGILSLGLLPGRELSKEDIRAGVSQVIHGTQPAESSKPAVKPPGFRLELEKKALRDYGAMIDAMDARAKTFRTAIGAAETRSLVKEYADKELTRQLLEGVAAGHIAPGITERDEQKEPSKSMTSGKFGEFLQTAGLGGTAYIRKTPAIVQLEKQTKLSERMAKSLDDFNASLDDLVGNTVER